MKCDASVILSLPMGVSATRQLPGRWKPLVAVKEIIKRKATTVVMSFNLLYHLLCENVANCALAVLWAAAAELPTDVQTSILGFRKECRCRCC